MKIILVFSIFITRILFEIKFFMRIIPYHDIHNFQTQEIDLDDILPKIGEFGRYQKLMLWLVCLPACFPCGFCAFNQLFMTDTPPHWCWIPELHNLTLEQRKMLSIPNENGTKYSKCYQYDRNWTNIFRNDSIIRNGESKKTVGCQNGWEYDMSEIQSTIVKDVS